MKTIYTIGIAISLLAFSCSDDESAKSSSVYVIGDKNNRATVAMYEYPARKLTADVYNVGGEFYAVAAAAHKNGENFYLNTISPSILRKVDLRSGSDLKSLDLWNAYDQAITFHGKDVVICNLHLDGPENATVIKIYDENLNRKDSIAFAAAYRLRAALVQNDRLFISLQDDVGAHIAVYDFLTSEFLEPIALPGICLQLISLENNKILAVLGNQYLTFDANTMQKSEPVTAYIGSSPAAYDPATKKLIWLMPVAQPALIPYFLGEMDLATGETKALSTELESIVGPLVYDAETKLIFTGPGIKTFSREAKLLHSVETPSTTKFILLR